MRISLVLFLIILAALGFQNCVGTVPVKFIAQEKSPLSSSMAEGGGLYDGKPENGYYCRVYDNISCQSQVNNLQGLVKVDNSGVHLLEDNCASTSSTFFVGDAGVGFTSLAPNFIAITRGIFKRCEVGADNLPPAPTEMTDAVCISKQNDVAVILTKNTLRKNMDFTLNFRDTTGIRSAVGQSVTKIISTTGSRYFSDTQDFNLTIDLSRSQTSQGHLQVVVDQKSLSLDLNCRQANPDPTIIIEKDMELSSTWMDTNRLVGYWKLNETNAVPPVSGTFAVRMG